MIKDIQRKKRIFRVLYTIRFINILCTCFLVYFSFLFVQFQYAKIEQYRTFVESTESRYSKESWFGFKPTSNESYQSYFNALENKQEGEPIDFTEVELEQYGNALQLAHQDRLNLIVQIHYFLITLIIIIVFSWLYYRYEKQRLHANTVEPYNIGMNEQDKIFYNLLLSEQVRQTGTFIRLAGSYLALKESKLLLRDEQEFFQYIHKQYTELGIPTESVFQPISILSYLCYPISKRFLAFCLTTSISMVLFSRFDGLPVLNIVIWSLTLPSVMKKERQCQTSK